MKPPDNQAEHIQEELTDSDPPETREEQERRVAKELLRPELQSAMASEAAYSAVEIEGQPFFDLSTLADELEHMSKAVIQGDLSRAERLTISQATTLDFLFTRLTSLAFRNLQHPRFDSFMRLALRAQAQSARTVETLATLKNPAIFAKQVNVANQQLVNNGTVSTAPSTAAALAESSPIVCLAHSEIPTPAHEQRMD